MTCVGEVREVQALGNTEQSGHTAGLENDRLFGGGGTGPFRSGDDGLHRPEILGPDHAWFAVDAGQWYGVVTGAALFGFLNDRGYGSPPAGLKVG